MQMNRKITINQLALILLIPAFGLTVVKYLTVGDFTPFRFWGAPFSLYAGLASYVFLPIIAFLLLYGHLAYIAIKRLELAQLELKKMIGIFALTFVIMYFSWLEPAVYGLLSMIKYNLFPH